MIDVEGGNNMLYVPLDKIMEQNATAGRLGSTTQDLRDLANQLAPFLPGPSTANSVDRTRLGAAEEKTMKNFIVIGTLFCLY